MFRKIWLIALASILISSVSDALPGYTMTKSRIKRLNSTSVVNTDLATSVPANPEQYTYTVEGSINDVAVFTDKVPLWDFDSAKKRYLVGSVPIGSNVTFETVMLYRGTLYYGLPIPNLNKQEDKESIGWIEGYYLKITGVNSATRSATDK